jgi:serine O-acetyltransferase
VAKSASSIAPTLPRDGRPEVAHFLQSRVSQVFAVDIHPAVPVGSGVFIDRGTGLVVGETAVIGDDVSILYEVTLGGTGKERGDRHPKVRDGVLLCAGVKALGNVEIGRDAKVGAGSWCRLRGHTYCAGAHTPDPP